MKSVYFNTVASFTLVASLALSACGTNQVKEDDPGPAPAIELATDSGEAAELFTEARQSLIQGKFETAVLQYENLEATYPFGDHAAQARLDVGYAYYQQGELDNALATLDRYLKLYPQSEQSDYAYYLKGLANYSRGKSLFDSLVPRKLHQLDQAWLRTALADFSTLERKFPQSKYVADAQRRSLQLKDQMAEHELSTARYYFGRSAMVAAINRINAMFEQYPESSKNAEGLALLARAHRALGNKKSADEATAMLREKYPNYSKI